MPAHFVKCSLYAYVVKADYLVTIGVPFSVKDYFSSSQHSLVLYSSY